MRRLKEDIKSKSFHNLYLLYGEEDYLKKLYKNSLKEAVLDGSDEMNYSYFEGKETDTASVKEIADTLPFFSDYRIVIIEDSGLFKSANDLSDYFPNMPSSTIVLFVENEIDKRNKLYKYVNKEGIAVEMKQMSPADTKQFIGLKLKENGKKIKENTVDYFLQQTDNSMINIINELDKLIAYTEGRSEITIADIDAVCCVQVTGRIFQMIDYAAMGKKNDTLKLYSDLLELRESPMSILYLLTRQFNILLQIKDIADEPKGEIASKLSIPPFTVGKYISQAKRFEKSRLRSMLNECIETEYNFKRGIISDQIGVELLLLKFAS